MFVKRPINEPNETFKCVDCGRAMILRANSTTGRVFFACSQSTTCGATHPAHQDGTPQGEMAPRDLRNARKRAFDAMGRYLEASGDDRRAARAEMTAKLGFPNYFAINEATAEQCQAIQGLFDDLRDSVVKPKGRRK